MRENKWVKCPICGHKLFINEGGAGEIQLQTKCHSCKNIITMILSNSEVRFKTEEVVGKS